MLHAFSRSEELLGKEGLQILANSKVAVFGIGGVGSYVVEALARAGVGNLTLVDHDEVSLTNLNRQLVALRSTMGKKKVSVAKERIMDINQDAIVHTYDTFFYADTAQLFDFSGYDYIVDAVDTVTAKIKLVEIAQEKKIKIISSMGTGNKLDPTKLEVTDIYKTSICPLARVMRRELKKRKIPALKVVYSTEKPIETDAPVDPETHKKTPGSISFVPSCAGLIIASVVVRDLLHIK